MTNDKNRYELAFKEKRLRNLVVWVQLPGIQQEKIDISLSGNVLTIKQTDDGGGRTLLRPEIVGESVVLRACLDRVAEAASSDNSVLICGETGTGKELFARAIHHNSRREKENFVVVDCRSIPEPLAEKLLYGQRNQDGLLQQAEYGTLFLDEVADLPLATQQLIQVLLRERNYHSSGRRNGLAASFRLIAATNRQLEQLVNQGKFNRDLYRFLQPTLIEIPPLRQRFDDIDLLTDFFLQRYSRRHQLPIKARSPEFMQMLRQYPWPGNIRELVNSLEQAMLVAKNKKTLFPKDLPAHIRVQVKKSIIDKKKNLHVEPSEPFFGGLFIADNPL